MEKDLFLTLALFALMFVGIVLSIFLDYRQWQLMIAEWGQLAMRTGLTLDRGSWLGKKPRVTGEYRRHPIKLTTYTRGYGRNRATYTLITLQVTNTQGTLALSPSGALTRAMGKALGMQDVQIGSEEFDKHFTVKSQPPEFAVELLGGDLMLCDGITRLKPGWFELKLKGTQLAYEICRETNPDRLEAMFNTLSDLADKIEGRGKERF